MVDSLSQTKVVIDSELSDAQILDYLKKAYTFGYPMLLMDYTKKQKTNVKTPNGQGSAPVNYMARARETPGASFRAVVKPNVDTLYTNAWLDLSIGPLIFNVPSTKRKDGTDQYYLVPFLDAYSSVFHSIGTNSTGSAPQTYFITGPFWDGTKLRQLISSKLMSLPKKKQPQCDILNIPIPDRTEGLSATHQSWDRSGFSKVQNDALDTIPTLAFYHLAKMQEIGSPSIEKETITDSSKYVQNKVDKGNWMVILNNIGEYGTHYFQRAFIAYAGLAANLIEDAIYPGSIKDTAGNLLDSTYNYVVTFKAGELPPVNAFWSLTVYNQDDYLVANPINRYSLGDRSPLVFEANGDLKLYVQNQTPDAPIPESNWLPSAPSGNMTLMLRMYWPKAQVINCQWNYPTITKLPVAALEEAIPAMPNGSNLVKKVETIS